MTPSKEFLSNEYFLLELFLNKINVGVGQYWDEFYKKKVAPLCPSQFAALTAQFLKSDDVLFDFGCGNGRDTLFFAPYVTSVVHIDRCDVAKQEINMRLNHLGYDNCQGYIFDIGNGSDINEIIECIALNNVNKRNIFYARFFLHAIDELAEENFVEAISIASKANDMLFLEFRTLKNKNEYKTYDDHYRRFINHKELNIKIKNYGWNCEYEYEGRGVACFKSEDPSVARLIYTKI
ncbi:hypothetical protein ICN17_01330 [Polynucleobacter sp. 73C-SIWE]|uniref:class I SAM-dependent methyltransferase n=1 Tax=Polynucleobacter sp. 73C-SIWE TaxID=2689098 RepID=UPI001C0B3C57|nr:class I SAM-dependent methyltransferase [Polynucleobacter sp. 73C-SIWE]MBU3578644.1 hypothetical protein [Polynucleobacter sp. 73C-SIWE]